MDNPTVSTNEGSNDPNAELKTRFANLLINRVALSECLNVIRDACVQRATELLEQADEAQLENIKKDIELFENPPKPESPDSSDGVQGPQGDDGEGVQGGPEVTPINPTSGPQFQANEGVQGVQGPEA